MKKITLVFAFMLAVAGAAAQSMYVHKTDGNVYEFKVSDVDSINFAASTTDDYLYTVTYMPNGGEGEVVVDTVRYGKSYKFRTCFFTHSDTTLFQERRWCTKPDGIGANFWGGETIQLMRNLTLYAVWQDGQGVSNGHAYVDLGLSVLWATCNVGADSPEEYGDYFAWGELEPKTTYDWTTYKWCNGSSITLTKYCTDSKTGIVDYKVVLDKEDDAAAVNMGGSWRMPTKAEQDELRTECTWTWTRNYNGTGVAGSIVTSKINGNSIFLPAAGHRYNSDLYNAGSFGLYWSSSLNTSNSDRAYYLNFGSDGVDRSYSTRYDGRSVRGVCP